MHSVGRSSEPGDPVRGSVAQADPVVVAPPVGSSASAQVAAVAEPLVAPIAIARAAFASVSLDDPSFKPMTRAHDLLRAIDPQRCVFAMKGWETPFGGMTDDVSAERRKIDFPPTVTALDGLAAGQVKRVEEDLLEGGQSGRKADLTPDQVAPAAGAPARRHQGRADPARGDGRAARLPARGGRAARGRSALEAGGAGRARQRLEAAVATAPVATAPVATTAVATAAVATAERRLNDLLDILADRTGRNP